MPGYSARESALFHSGRRGPNKSQPGKAASHRDDKGRGRGRLQCCSAAFPTEQAAVLTRTRGHRSWEPGRNAFFRPQRRRRGPRRDYFPRLLASEAPATCEHRGRWPKVSIWARQRRLHCKAREYGRGGQAVDRCSRITGTPHVKMPFASGRPKWATRCWRQSPVSGICPGTLGNFVLKRLICRGPASRFGARRRSSLALRWPPSGDVHHLPPTLVASIYGMNFEQMPKLKWMMGYPWALGLMVLSAVLPYIYFKRRG